MGLLDSIPFFRRSQPASAPAPQAAKVEVPAPAPQPEPVVAAELPVVEQPAPVITKTPEPKRAPEPAAPSPAERAEAEKLVRTVVGELPEFVTVAVLEKNTGRILSGQWAGHSGGAVEAAAANAEMVRHMHDALAAMQVSSDEQIQDVVITLQRQLHLIRLVPDKAWLLYLAVRIQDTNFALARTVLQNSTV